MPIPNFPILGVKDPLASAAFYARLIGHPAAFSAPTFVSFDLGHGFSLGLWSLSAPGCTLSGVESRSELAFTAADEAEVRRLHDEWSTAGIPITEGFHIADFGPTFVGLDPDGHRLRVCLVDQ